MELYENNQIRCCRAHNLHEKEKVLFTFAALAPGEVPSYRVEQRAVHIEETGSAEAKSLMQQLQGKLCDLQ